ncbi:hypothetical protein PMAYCL1PPCAC_07696 [Pristionchus mayeri]|uniref:BZIP domain-containing protein n=1 Tax=Pristionchus mayeri TaxID=1317129 RepID=A0AAN4ZBA8_9BILA|nr:hypothetical protein PMAYCL1PPCAC_07696 [Pristionchus mayeri]
MLMGGQRQNKNDRTSMASTPIVQMAQLSVHSPPLHQISGMDGMQIRSMSDPSSPQFTQLQQCGPVWGHNPSSPRLGYGSGQGTPTYGNGDDEERAQRSSREASSTSSSPSQKEYRKYDKIPDNKKTPEYWERRKTNREAVRKSREKKEMEEAEEKRKIEEEREKNRVAILARNWIIKRAFKRLGEEEVRELSLGMSPHELEALNDIFPNGFKSNELRC